MMRIDVSRRGFGSLDPSFESVEEVAKGWAASDPTLRYELDGIRAERAELLELIAGERPDSIALARDYVDSKINAILPQQVHKQDWPLVYIDYKERLAALDEARVLYVLRVRGQLRSVLKHASVAQGIPAPECQSDLDRVMRMLRLIDYSVFFGRPDFRAERFFSPLSGKTIEGNARRWYPALVVLAWFDAELQRDALTLCRRLEQRADDQTRDLIRDTQYSIFALNEAVFATISKIASRQDAKPIFDDFRPHRIQWKAIHFRLLAETTVIETASAESLCRDCFRGVLNNLAIATAGRPPSDEDVHNRLFGSLDYCWPEEYRRTVDYSWPKDWPKAYRHHLTGLNIDTVVRMADRWIEQPGISQPLRAGAETFLAEAHKDLLSNAQSVPGVLAPLGETLARYRDGSTRYRRFYDSFLTADSEGAPLLSAPLEKPLASPFFRAAADRQHGDIEEMLAFWRTELARRVSGREVGKAEAACRRDFGHIISRLVQGIGRDSNDDPYPFEPAGTLIKEKGVRREPPAEFFELVRWWAGLAKPNDPPAVQWLFRPDADSQTDQRTAQAGRVNP
ncbi:MAG: hypothetical protein ACYTG0_11815 [Planctomycetota bacterium]|jgi:hypothetical protein